MTRSARDVKAFFEQVPTDWDEMRLAYYDERVRQVLTSANAISSRWFGE
jgi:hypothetical protein